MESHDNPDKNVPPNQPLTTSTFPDQISNTNSALPVMPAEQSPVTPTPSQQNLPKKSSYAKKVSLVVVVAVGCLIFTSWYLLRNQHTTKSISNINSSSKAQSTSAGTDTILSHRLYATKTQLTLTDLNGNVIATQPTNSTMHLVANLEDQNFLLVDDTAKTSSPDDYGGHYWIMNDSGKLSAVTQNVDTALRKDAGDSNAIGTLYPISATEVLYYQCNSSNEQSCGSLHKLDILSGKEQTYQAIDNGGPLIGVSKDRKTTYLFGFNGSALVLVSYDLSTGKVVKKTPLPATSQSVRQFWVSPNGTYVSYADETNHVVFILSISSGGTTKVQLPASWDLELWSGETAGPTPTWSQDEQNLSFAAFENTSESLVNISIPKSKYQVLDKISSDLQAISTGGSSNTFDAVGWLSNSELDYSVRNADGSANNFSQKISENMTALPNNYGELLELVDGRAALY